MHYTDTTRITADMFRTRTATKKAVILHPATPYRTLFLAHSLEAMKDDKDILYFRAFNTHLTYSDFLRDFIEDVARDSDDFALTRQRLAGETKGLKPEAMGEALAADFERYSDREILIIWDDMDRIVDDPSFVPCIHALIASLPAHFQIVFNSRLLHVEPWNTLIARGDAVVFGREYYQGAGMFSTEDAHKPQLEIVGFGRGHVRVNGNPITQWDGALPRNLFFYLIDRPLVTRNEIFETFWPNLPIREATNVFHVTKRKITERIGDNVRERGAYELTRYKSGYYLPSDSVVRHSDVADFTAFVEQATMSENDDEACDLYTCAVALYRAPFLDTVDMPWAQHRRGTLREQWIGALGELGRIYQKRNAHEQALGYTLRALREVPEREDLHCEAVNLYLRMNRIADARAQYDRLETMTQKLRITPSQQSRELYARLQTVAN